MPDSRSPLLRAAAPTGLHTLFAFWKLKRARRKPTPQRGKPRWLAATLVAALGLMLLDALYIATRLPDWRTLADGPAPKSRFIATYEAQRADDSSLPAVRWKPVPMAAIPTHVIRAVVVAEDSRFYSHSGFDTEALQDAMETNLSKGRFAYGGSTISQQTAKNLFFSPSRNPLRKWHELIFTYFMEKNLRKRRILEIYLNVAEFGRGIYGVEAAAEAYFHKSISSVSVDEAIELAATLPGPVSHNPKSRTRFFIRHSRTIARHFYVGQEPAPNAPPQRAPEAEFEVPVEPSDEMRDEIVEPSPILPEPPNDIATPPAEPLNDTPEPPAAPDRPD